MSLDEGTIYVLDDGSEQREMTQTVSERWLTAFAAAVGDTRSPYFDLERLDGIVAHPIFPACLEWPLVADGAPGIALTKATLNRGLHVEQSSRLLSTIAPGMKLTTVAELVIAEKRTNAVHIATEFRTSDSDGECVAVTRTHMLYPEVELVGRKVRTEPRPDRPSRATDLKPVGAFPVDQSNAIIYTECSRIWNPIHTDPRVAKGAGLAEPVLHGTETLARAISIITSTLPGKPTDVASISCRFTAPVVAGMHVQVRASMWRQSLIDFDVIAADGTILISDGHLSLGGPLSEVL